MAHLKVRPNPNSFMIQAKGTMARTIHSETGGWVGQSLRRKEDARLVRGKGKFVDDIKMLGMLHLVFVRSPFAHARITAVDVSGSRSGARRGVHAHWARDNQAR